MHELARAAVKLEVDQDLLKVFSNRDRLLFLAGDTRGRFQMLVEEDFLVVLKDLVPEGVLWQVPVGKMSLQDERLQFV